jgi:hypothetical protein
MKKPNIKKTVAMLAALVTGGISLTLIGSAPEAAALMAPLN